MSLSARRMVENTARRFAARPRTLHNAPVDADSQFRAADSREAPLLDAARDILRRTFGHAEFRGLQADVIGEVLAGRSAMAVLPTGGGKSLCYQIPALVRPGLGLVVSPLIALMADQVAALQQSGVAAERLDSNIDPETRGDIWRRIDDGRAGPALPLARRADAALDAGAAVAPAAGADRHRRGPLRQPVGPRLPARVPHAGPAGRGLPGRAAPGGHRHRRRPHPRGHPRRAAARGRRASSSTASRGPSWPCRPSASAAQGHERVLELVAERPGRSGVVYAGSRDGVDKLAETLARRGRAGARLSRRPRQAPARRPAGAVPARPTRR